MNGKEKREAERVEREAKILEAEFMLLEDEANGLSVQTQDGISTDFCRACTSMPRFSEKTYTSPRVILRIKFCTACKREERSVEVKPQKGK